MPIECAYTRMNRGRRANAALSSRGHVPGSPYEKCDGIANELTE